VNHPTVPNWRLVEIRFRLQRIHTEKIVREGRRLLRSYPTTAFCLRPILKAPDSDLVTPSEPRAANMDGSSEPVTYSPEAYSE
jgi:hypothetical protein